MDCSLLNALDVTSPMGPRSSRFDTKSSSERGNKRRRCSPYAKKRKLLPKKSFSLETIPLRPHIERSQSFELTQSSKDQTSIKSESSIDLGNDFSTVAEFTQATDWPTLEDEFSICFENDYSASTSRPLTDCLHRSVDSELTFEHLNICKNDADASQPTVNFMQSTTEPSESSIDLENDYSTVEETTRAERLLPTLEDEFSICFEHDGSASIIQSECLHRSGSAELTLEHGSTCNTEAETSLTLNLMQSTTEPPESSIDQDTSKHSSVTTKTDQPLTERLLWSAYAKLMTIAWRNTRENLNEQTHRAETCELQAKSTMTQVYSMKTQLKADISEMKERVKKIQSVRVILDSTEEDKNKLQTENDNLKAKIECINEEQSKLRQERSSADQLIEEFHAEAESMKTQIKVCDDEIAELKAEKKVLDGEFQQLMSLSEQAKENVEIGRMNIYNRELEINDIERELAASKEKISIETRMCKTVREQAQVISKEIETATNVGEALQKQLAETREKVMDRDSMVAELSAKVSAAAEQISSMKDGVQTSKPFLLNFLRRFRFLPKDSPSLLSIQL